jgi:beta-lactamase regulating signal transducer with metallopeptidase domain
MLCILYVNFIGACLSIIGHLVERALPATASRRWIWCAVIVFSMALPGYYRSHHSWNVTAGSEQPAAGQTAAGQTAPGEMTERNAPQTLALGTAWLSPFDKDFWARVESYDTKINQFWLILSGLLLIWGVTNAMRVSDAVGSSRGNQSDPRNPTVIDGIPIVITDAAGPATVGVLRSRVLVPRWVLGLPGPQRKYVLRHEDEHRRAHDARLLFVASLPLLLMPWNLALWWELRRLCLAVEMDCDNRVVAALGNPNAYGELLFKVAQAANRGPRLQPAFLGMGSLERRLTLLLAPTPLRHAQKFLVPALAFVLLLAVLAIPHPVLPNHQHSAMMAGATTSTSQR